VAQDRRHIRLHSHGIAAVVAAGCAALAIGVPALAGPPPQDGGPIPPQQPATTTTQDDTPLAPLQTSSRATTTSSAALPRRWRFVDTQLKPLDRLWIRRRGVYDRSPLLLQAVMLQVHAEALAVHAPGAVRRDERIAPLIRRILRPGTLRTKVARPASRVVNIPHVPGFYNDNTQHFSIDPPVVLALARAWQVRWQAHLSRELAAKARAAVLLVAQSRFYRWPSVRFGQLNWWTDVEAAAAMVGRKDILARDYPRQLNRLARASRRQVGTMLTAQLNAGLGWRYNARQPADSLRNRTSTSEYGALAISAIRHQSEARAAGMAPLPITTQRFVRTWSCRVLAGEWTHAGYLNWDSGLGSQREHLARYWAHALSGLYALATAPRSLRCAADSNKWAGWMFQRALDRYARLAAESPTGLLAPRPWGMTGPFSDPVRDPPLAAARVLAVAVRYAAVHPRPVQPPNLAAHDPDIRRIAVTTPHYATALHGVGTPMTRGGLGLSRLHAPDGDLLAPIRPPRGGWFAPLVDGGKTVPDGAWDVRSATGNTFRRGTFTRISARACGGPSCIAWRFDATGADVVATLTPKLSHHGYVALPTAMGAYVTPLPDDAGWRATNAHGSWELYWDGPPPPGPTTLVHRGRGRHDLVFALQPGTTTRIAFRLEIQR